MQVRTRFAPSPTGLLHVGGVRTALFAWLLARQNKGVFILRLEDTDKAREVEGSGQHIMDSLRELGLQWDEGLEVGGPYGPYKQSERLDIYHEWAHKLVASGRAYADPYSQTELEQFREEAKQAKKPFLFRNHRPGNPPAWDGKQPLRFKSDPKVYKWHDEVMGDLSAGPEVIDDFIIMKSDGYPTYNFAHIVDDYLMKVSHVIRSQEFIASVPRYLNLYEALDIERPLLATVPFIMGPDGKKKLSKRDGAKDVLDYTREGFLPETLDSFIATLGWNDGTEQEVFTLDELVQKFSLNHVQHSGARFDEQRLLWMNGVMIRKMPLDTLYEKVATFWPERAKAYDDAYKKQVLGLVQERLKYFGELPALTRFFFEDLPVNLALVTEHKQLSKLEKGSVVELLQTSHDALSKIDFTVETLSDTLNHLLEQTNQKPVILFSLIRTATTQAPASPGLADTLTVLGKETSLRRLEQTISAWK
jgi:glutamyl-tRNA synthetase